MALNRTETRVAPAFARAADQIREALEAAVPTGAVVPVGALTHGEVGCRITTPPSLSAEVRAPSGIAVHEAADMTITVGAATTVREVAEALAASGQECPLDPRSRSATVGGVLASGLSGPRRLRLGPVRDCVLEVRFVTGDGRLVQAGGPTVKNVSGYDLPRLLVGSLGTLGVLVQVTLRCRPLPQSSAWFLHRGGASELRGRLFAPSSLLWDGRHVHVLLEGHPDDVAEQAAVARLTGTDSGPALPEGPHRGRVSVQPGALDALAAALDAVEGCRWLSELGVGTVHVACDTDSALAETRAAAHRAGGWLLREAGAPALDGLGRPLPNVDVMRRVKHAFDPFGVMSPGRLPL